jgi:Rod binding domain-containing protein
LLIAQMLRQAREAAGEGAGETTATVMEMAEQRMAEVMAAEGGLGLAGLILRQLERQ